MATEVKKPTAFTDGSAVWSNEGQAYDTVTAGDETTYADSTMSGDFNPSILFYAWGTKGQTYTATVLKVKWLCAQAQTDDTWGIQYTKNGGSNWYDLLAEGNNSSAVIVTEQVSLDTDQDLTQVQVKVVSNQTKNPDGHNVRIYDVWTEGEYTAGSTTYYQDAGQHAMTMAGSMARMTSKYPGSHSMTIAGALTRKGFKDTGGHVMVVEGALLTTTTYVRAVGGYALQMTGSLLKQTSIYIGKHLMTIAGDLSKKGFKDTGGYQMPIVGTLATASIFFQAVGEHAMTIVGTLGTITTYIRAVGAYAMTIVGTLVKRTSIYPGGHSIQIAGGLIRKGFKDVGGYAMTIVGTMSTAIVIGQTVGSYAVTITGALFKKTSIYLGSHVMSIIGSLIKGSFKDTGGYSMPMTGGLIKKTSTYPGKHSMSITGTLQAAAKYLVDAGQHAMSVIGALATQFTAGGGPGGSIKRMWSWFWEIF